MYFQNAAMRYLLFSACWEYEKCCGKSAALAISTYNLHESNAQHGLVFIQTTQTAVTFEKSSFRQSNNRAGERSHSSGGKKPCKSMSE